MILYGQPVKEKILADARNILNELKENGAIKPKLIIIQIGDLDRSSIYVKQKMKACDGLGIEHEHLHLLESITLEELREVITNVQKNCTGLFIQLPLPEHLEPYRQELIDLIDPLKDVDCLTTHNIGKLATASKSEELLTPATARGVIEMLEYYFEDSLEGKTVAVMGRSNLVGRPLIQLLLNKNASVISSNSYTPPYRQLLFNEVCDILILATGNALAMESWMMRSTAKVIDVGISVIIDDDGNRKIVGDFNPTDAEDMDYSPVPKGVGVTTVASLLYNVALSAKLQQRAFTNNN